MSLDTVAAPMTSGMRTKLNNDYRAFAKLALTERRLSWVSRHRALECEQDADLDGYRRWKADAKKLWRDARYHLGVAQDRKAALNG